MGVGYLKGWDCRFPAWEYFVFSPRGWVSDEDFFGDSRGGAYFACSSPSNGCYRAEILFGEWFLCPLWFDWFVLPVMGLRVLYLLDLSSMAVIAMAAIAGVVLFLLFRLRCFVEFFLRFMWWYW